MKTLPRKLLIRVGGYMGPSYSVELRGGKLRYEATKARYAEPRSEFIIPTEKQWTQFRSVLDSIRVWQWLSDYPNPGVCDGTNWRAEVVYDDAEVVSHGDNNYPNAGGQPSGTPGGTREFRRLTKAVRALLGGRDFE